MYFELELDTLIDSCLQEFRQRGFTVKKVTVDGVEKVILTPDDSMVDPENDFYAAIDKCARNYYNNRMKVKS